MVLSATNTYNSELRRKDKARLKERRSFIAPLTPAAQQESGSIDKLRAGMVSVPDLLSPALLN